MHSTKTRYEKTRNSIDREVHESQQSERSMDFSTSKWIKNACLKTLNQAQTASTYKDPFDFHRTHPLDAGRLKAFLGAGTFSSTSFFSTLVAFLPTPFVLPLVAFLPTSTSFVLTLVAFLPTSFFPTLVEEECFKGFWTLPVARFLPFCPQNR